MNYQHNSYGALSNIPPATKNIILVNVVIFLATLLREDFMIRQFAMFYPASPFFHPWQIVTHMFMHGGFWHIFLNMYTLFIFGLVLERTIGTRKFISFYFICGLGAVALHTGVQWLQVTHALSIGDNATVVDICRTPTVGASGAIYGILLGYAMLYPQSRLTLLFPPVTLTAKWFVAIFAGIELFTGIFMTTDGIAHFAHLGGMLFALLLMIFWKRTNRLYDEHRWI